MSQGIELSRKERKSLRDSERSKHGKKRKHSDLQPDISDQATGEDVTSKATLGVKGLGEHTDNADISDLGVVDTVGDDRIAPDTTSKPKKKRKVTKATAATLPDGTAQEPLTKSRFILFIGNLPYSTTDASLQAHFEKLKPFNLRHRTDPKSKKSKGFAFLEFENYDRMKTCLKLYHHSMFDPDATENGGNGKGNGKGGRRINVELTAGGGGKAENRKEKIKVKNVRLEEQRKRRVELERKEKEKKDKKEKSVAKGENVQQEETRSPEEALVEGNDDADGIHPSRRARVKT